MRKLLFNWSLYSHPEIGNFRVWQLFPSMFHLILLAMCYYLSMLIRWYQYFIWTIKLYCTFLHISVNPLVCLLAGPMSFIFVPPLQVSFNRVVHLLAGPVRFIFPCPFKFCHPLNSILINWWVQ
jgi:hypothetical protein